MLKLNIRLLDRPIKLMVDLIGVRPIKQKIVQEVDYMLLKLKVIYTFLIDLIKSDFIHKLVRLTGLPTFCQLFPVHIFEITVHLPFKTVLFTEIRRKESLTCKYITNCYRLIIKCTCSLNYVKMYG